MKNNFSSQPAVPARFGRRFWHSRNKRASAEALARNLKVAVAERQKRLYCFLAIIVHLQLLFNCIFQLEKLEERRRQSWSRPDGSKLQYCICTLVSWNDIKEASRSKAMVIFEAVVV